ncbi:tRNA:m4X modification enzyme [Cyberlindnera jadinii NRRL Y-1542]|uniref:tRNA:m(4)X modification enzyme TRM13 n=1 Tax=Cyberlindnera jadinii (strain ATCC 18201 / CBS 1600 / BCRC 20928 / JCM 3617 / NBRC 0987 / NRRL Y-1542) TaxID=983966 RepID=A0A1E4RVZ2_CYBJN|nr:2'-O-methyltransferase responsible for modification of tRNA at position 4 [Cyberlindnera jadinii NRRL Y-1542]ODV71410.1 2'-O-methyltransferase responsible for modification of tRNA at position 4 [Cyberlindnera jadinii NRRL Y-1542]
MDEKGLRISAKQKKRKLEGRESKERLQCEFIIKKKNRRCPLTRKSDTLYCAEHLKQRGDSDLRVPCPIDPRHSVWTSELKSHLKKCTKLKEQALEDPWFKKDYNCCEASDGKVEEFKENYRYWIELVNRVVDAYEPLKLEQDEHEGVEERMNEKQNQKHAIQQSSLISQLDKNKLLSKDIDYIEFGCGRAELSRYLLQSVIHKDGQPTGFILIDRSPTRMKLDSKMAKDCEDRSLAAPNIFRAKIDIKDLYIDQIISTEFPDSKGFVAVSKHLCGAATDLTIQCILNNNQLRDKFQGMIIAMCCRHCCNYSQLHPLSKGYLLSRGIDQVGFKHLMKFASWAVNGRRPEMASNDGADHPSGLTIGEREQLGLRARRIIDESRRYVLQSSGFTVKLCHYVTSDVSLENTCMVVTKL